VQDVALDGRQLESPIQRRQVLPLREEEPHQQLPGAAGVTARLNHATSILDEHNS